MTFADSLICVDAGTTNTRVWLTRGGEILAHAQASVGVRDTARDGSPGRLRAALRDLVIQMRRQANDCGAPQPVGIAAAGMITSRLGLAEVPHVPAPAGLDELRSGIERLHCAEVSDLPIVLVPGVRSGPAGALGDALDRDVMRGEETLCIGLLHLGLAKAGDTVLNLGSHWKVIRIDAQARVASSLTSMSGELIHATQTQTILASAVPPRRLAALDETWCELGMREQERSGLGRALFCVRLLEIHGQGAPEQRLSFLAGAILQSDLAGFWQRGAFAPHSPVVIAGGGVLAEAWSKALGKRGISAATLAEADLQKSLLRGLRAITSGAM